jgi:hypothetical protein
MPTSQRETLSGWKCDTATIPGPAVLVSPRRHQFRLGLDGPKRFDNAVSSTGRALTVMSAICGDLCGRRLAMPEDVWVGDTVLSALIRAVGPEHT